MSRAQIRDAIAELVSCWLAHKRKRHAGSLTRTKRAADALGDALSSKDMEHTIWTRAAEVALHWYEYGTISARKMVRLIQAYEQIFGEKRNELR